MKLAISTTLTLTLLTATSEAIKVATSSANNDLADCFRGCEERHGEGSGADNCRSKCRSGNTRTGRDYKNSARTRKPTNRPNSDRRATRKPTGRPHSNRNRRPTGRPTRRPTRFVDDFTYDDYIYIDDYYYDDATAKEVMRGAFMKNEESEWGLSMPSKDDDGKEPDEKDDDDKKESDDKEDDDDKEKEKEDDDDKEKEKEDDDDDDDKAKEKDEDDDDDNKKKKDHETILPECEIDGKNYMRCDPEKIEKGDVLSCEEIDEFACNKERVVDDKEDYCECIGLEYYEPESSIAQLRGVFKTLYAHN